ncbi:fused MFS/spermidine synthase [Nocardioidaceae bacterium]|nr:fused MFS/spermidine synthase [Nocardioidaceae bacterium]
MGGSAGAVDRSVVPAETVTSWLVTLGGRPQSHVDLADPTRIAFDYVRRAADVLDALAPPGERLATLHVGGAGMTLARYLAATRPTSRQVVLEPDAELTALVRAQLPLPRRSGIKVREVDGATGLAAIRDDSFAACVVDAFDGEGRTPAELLGPEAAVAYARVLGPAGTLVANVRDRQPHPLVRGLVTSLRGSFAEVRVGAEPATWKGRRDGNLLVVAGPDARAAQALEEAGSRRAAPYRVVAGDRL